MTFEDPTALARCIKSDCQRIRAGGTPFCAEHLREQEVKSTGIVEPDVEAKARAAGEAAMQLYVGPDPDTNGVMTEDEKQAVITMGKSTTLRAHGMTERPDPTELEPHWDGTQWVLREKQQNCVTTCPHCGGVLEVRLS